MQKRGISPLIATVLLIGMVVAAAGIILLFTKDISEEIMEKSGAKAQQALACSRDVSIEIVDVQTDKFEIENTGGIKIDRFLLLLKQGDTVDSTQRPISIKPGESGLIPFDQGYEEVSVVPMISIGGNVYAPCSDRAQTYEI